MIVSLGIFLDGFVEGPATAQDRPSLPQLKPILIRIPPSGVPIETEQLTGLRNRVQALETRLETIDHPRKPDAAVLVKAVAWALRHHEFYKASDVAKAKELLTLAEQRSQQLAADSHPWTKQRGLTVAGYRSRIDNSLQPYGLFVPESLALDAAEGVPLIVWLHGRGDKVTDMHFLHQRLRSLGNVHPDFAITVHPFGRHCMGFKSAGEIDVLDVIEQVAARYPIDRRRIVLMGFSMGGAGAWHVGAHYTDRFRAISPGAGFAETARYTRLPVDQYPPWYEQRLWSVYDVPNYVRNLLDHEVVVYSGELDKQIQAARVMEEAYLAQQAKLPHLIGPGMGHKYHPDTLRTLLTRMRVAVAKTPEPPRRVRLQTRTLRYGKQHWVEALGLQRHWEDSRIDAQHAADELVLATRNITALRLTPPQAADLQRVRIDGATLSRPTGSASETIVLARDASPRGNGPWRWLSADAAGQRFTANRLAKRPGQQGPIDDVFLEPFLVVTPSGQAAHPLVERWVQFELDHFRKRWSSLYRGDLLIKSDQEVTEQDLQQRHVILFGDPSSNSVLQRVLSHDRRPPLSWTKQQIRLDDGREFPAAHHVPVLIYPNPLRPDRYVVINSGPTHREGHDRTNSLQNPKLPDWAMLDLRTPPDALAAGRVVDANFFDEQWRLRPADAR